jgi:hypothetical protein
LQEKQSQCLCIFGLDTHETIVKLTQFNLYQNMDAHEYHGLLHLISERMLITKLVSKSPLVICGQTFAIFIIFT